MKDSRFNVVLSNLVILTGLGCNVIRVEGVISILNPSKIVSLINTIKRALHISSRYGFYL